MHSFFFAHRRSMTHVTVSVQVAVSSDNEDWEIVDTPAPGHVNGNDGDKPMNVLGTDVDMPTDAAASGQVNGKDGDKRLMRYLGKWVIKRRAGLEQARLKDYYMAVREDAREAALIVTTPTRHRNHRTVKDFVAVAVKFMLYKEAMTRWSHMLNWCKLVKKDADDVPAPSHAARRPQGGKGYAGTATASSP